MPKNDCLENQAEYLIYIILKITMRKEEFLW